jgi:predicted DNA binding CopG/RHH family protein
MPRKLKKIPRFRDEEAERAFWSSHDATDYYDVAGARRVVLPNLKPSTETISLRLPSNLLADLKVLANRMDVPYQSLLKVYLAERIDRELAGDLSAADPASLIREPEAPYGDAPKGTHRRAARPARPARKPPRR